MFRHTAAVMFACAAVDTGMCMYVWCIDPVMAILGWVRDEIYTFVVAIAFTCTRTCIERLTCTRTERRACTPRHSCRARAARTRLLTQKRSRHERQQRRGLQRVRTALARGGRVLRRDAHRRRDRCFVVVIGSAASSPLLFSPFSLPLLLSSPSPFSSPLSPSPSGCNR